MNARDLIVLAAYAAGIAAYAASLFLPGRLRRTALVLHAVLVVAGTVHLAGYAMAHGRCPLANARDALFFSAWLLSILLLANDLACGRRSVAVFLLPAPAVLFLVAALSGPGPAWLPEGRSSGLFPLHVSLALSAFVLYAMAFLVAALQAKAHADLKAKRVGPLYARIPPLATLAREVGVLLLAANLLLPAGLAIGAYAAVRERLHAMVELKSAAALLCWLVFCGVSALRRRGLGPRAQLAGCALGVFLMVLTALLGRHAG